MEERNEKKKRRGFSLKRKHKKSEANVPVKKKGNDDETGASLLCVGRKRKKSFQYGNSMQPDDKELSSVHLKSTTSLEVKSQELKNIEHEELTSLRSYVERLQTEQNMQLTDIKDKTDKIKEVENELANVKTELDNECQIRRQLEADLNDHNMTIERIENAHKEQERCNNETIETMEKQFLEEKKHLESQLKKLKGERKALEEEKQDALMSLCQLNSCFQRPELMSPVNKEHIPVHLEITTCNSLPNDPDEGIHGQETTNIENENPSALKTEVLRVQTLHQKQTEAIATLKSELANIKTELDTECQTRVQIEKLLNDRNNEIEELKNKLKKRKHTNAALTRDLKSLTDDKERIDKQLQDQTQHYTNNLNENKRQIHKLKGDTKTLEEEKQDALRRLSAMMSVKLRDNNPNIADLSDQFRPTKLGEQFSELYDNEWTDAFDVLQNEFEERHAISVLLDIVLDTYQFCDTELQRVWQFANDWFIEESAPTTQQLSKTLKDSRKHNISRRVSDIEQKYTRYLSEMCDDARLSKMVTTDHFRKYISTCVRLSLLMTANDPPVVIECPGWQTFSERPYSDKSCLRATSADSKENDEAHDEKSVGKTMTNNSIFSPNDAMDNDDFDKTVHNDLPQEKDEAMYDASDDTHNAKIDNYAAVADLPSEQTTSPISDTTPVVKFTDITIGFPNEDAEKVIKGDENNDDQTSAVTGGMSTTGTRKTEESGNRSSDNLPDLETTEDNTQVAITEPDENINLPGNLKPKETEKDKSSSTIAQQETNAVQSTKIYHEKPSFDKDKFKEYTSRGPFVDYFVWPIMYLHRDGPMLGKGIAQGCKEKMEDVSREPFVWWKRLPTSQM